MVATILAVVSSLALLAVLIFDTSRRRGVSLHLLLRGAGVLLLATALASGLVAGGMVTAEAAFLTLALAVVLVIAASLPAVVSSEERRDKQLLLTRTAATILVPTTEPQPLLERVLDLAHASVHVDSSSIMLLAPETRQLRFAATRGLDLTRVRSYAVSLDNPAIAQLWGGQGPLVVPDVQAEPAFRRLLVRADLRSFFGMPMVARGTLVGFLNVHRTRPSLLSPDDLQALTVLAAQAASAILTSRLYADLQRRYLDTISALASAVEVNDPFTLGHCRRVAQVARLLAQEINLDHGTVEQVEVVALLHDVGKLGVGDAVLRKLGRLTPEEAQTMRSHAQLGAAVLRDVEALRDIAPSILHHHERWDGTGYPSGLRGTATPLAARLVAVADAYEVMTAGRPYRQARSAVDAVEEAKRMAGRQFDPTVVDALVRLHERGELPPPSGLADEAQQSAAS